MEDQCEALVLIKDMRMPVTLRCEGDVGHDETHFVRMGGCEPPALLVWDYTVEDS